MNLPEHRMHKLSFAIEAGPEPSARAPYSRSQSLALMDGSESLWREVAAASCLELGNLLVAAHAALTASDLARLMRLAHTIKSLCATLAAERARESARALELAAGCHDAPDLRALFDALDGEIGSLIEALRTDLLQP